MLNVADTIQIAKYSSLLASLDLEKGSTNNPALVPNLPDILTIEGGILQWLNDIDPSNADLTKVANYVYSLCGSYGLTAQAIISGGGGSVTPGQPSLPPPPYQFTVSASSFIATGESAKVITAFIGYNLIFIRGGVPQSTVNEGGTYYSWQSSTGTFTCVGAADEGELFQLYAI